MTTITFEKDLNIKKKNFQDIWDFLNTVLATYEQIEEKALWKIAKESDKWDFADMNDFYKSFKLPIVILSLSKDPF